MLDLKYFSCRPQSWIIFIIWKYSGLLEIDRSLESSNSLNLTWSYWIYTLPSEDNLQCIKQMLTNFFPTSWKEVQEIQLALNMLPSPFQYKMEVPCLGLWFGFSLPWGLISHHRLFLNGTFSCLEAESRLSHYSKFVVHPWVIPG